MVSATKIAEHMEVVGSDGQHVGTVDHMEGSGQIKLTKQDASSGGQHHLIPLAWVESVEDRRVRLLKPAAEAMRSWKQTM